MRQVIPNIYDTFTEEGRPGTVAAEVFEQFIWVTTGVDGRTPFKDVQCFINALNQSINGFNRIAAVMLD